MFEGLRLCAVMDAADLPLLTGSLEMQRRLRWLTVMPKTVCASRLPIADLLDAHGCGDNTADFAWWWIRRVSGTTTSLVNLTSGDLRIS